MCHSNTNQKKADVATLIADKIDFKAESVTGDKDGHVILVQMVKVVVILLLVVRGSEAYLPPPPSLPEASQCTFYLKQTSIEVIAFLNDPLGDDGFYKNL